MRKDPIVLVSFNDLDFSDPFFDSLRSSYNGFDGWFHRKATEGEQTYAVLDDDSGRLLAMLYLKDEDDVDNEIQPPLKLPRLKVGTFKVASVHHTSIGKRLLAITLRRFAEGDYQYAYVTMFDNATTKSLRALMEEYGFKQWATKTTTGESVLFKHRPKSVDVSHLSDSYPFIDVNSGNAYLLAILPQYHDLLFGDTQLRTQFGEPIGDDRTVNTIEKVYLSGAQNASHLVPGDHIVSYRTAPSGTPAYYSSVVSALGTVTKVRNISDFSTFESFQDFIKGRSVFTDDELAQFYAHKSFPWIITFLYNFRFSRYPNRQKLLEEGIIRESDRIVCHPITKDSLKEILELGATHESYIID